MLTLGVFLYLVSSKSIIYTIYTTRMKWKALLFLFNVIIFSCTDKDRNSNSFSETSRDSTSIWISTSKNKSLSKLERISLLNKASLLISQYPDNLIKTKSLVELSSAYRKIGDTISFLNKNKALINLSKIIEDFKSHGEGHWELAKYLRNTKPDSALYHYKEAYTLFLKADLDSTSKNYPGIVLQLAAILKDKNKDHTGAEKDIVKAIKFFKENDTKEKLFTAHNVLAITQNGKTMTKKIILQKR